MTALKRLAVTILTLAFLMGLTAQSVTYASMVMLAQGHTIAAAKLPTASEKPCSSVPCAEHPGCAVLAALPATPGAAPVPVHWVLVEYRELAFPLAGHAVEPELSPPILLT